MSESTAYDAWDPDEPMSIEVLEELESEYVEWRSRIIGTFLAGGYQGTEEEMLTQAELKGDGDVIGYVNQLSVGCRSIIWDLVNEVERQREQLSDAGIVLLMELSSTDPQQLESMKRFLDSLLPEVHFRAFRNFDRRHAARGALIAEMEQYASEFDPMRAVLDEYWQNSPEKSLGEIMRKMLDAGDVDSYLKVRTHFELDPLRDSLEKSMFHEELYDEVRKELGTEPPSIPGGGVPGS